MTKAVTYFFFFIGLLSGCASVPVPEQVEIESGIFSQPSKKSSVDRVEDAKNKRLALILSENTKNNINFLIESRKTYDSVQSVFDPNQTDPLRNAFRSSMDPQFSINWVTNSLKNTFKSVQVINASSEFDARFDLLGVLDYYYVHYHPEQKETQAKITLNLYEKDQNLINIASGSRSLPFGGWTAMTSSAAKAQYLARLKEEHETLVAALQAFDNSLALITLESVGRSASSGPQAVSYDDCMRYAMRIADKKLKRQAMAACDGAQ